MKKISLALIALFTFVNADILSISAGVGGWNEDIDGYVTFKGTKNYFDNKSAESDGNEQTGNFGLKTKTNGYVWLKFIHPIPIIPNIKLQYTQYDTTGYSNWVSGNIKIFGDVYIPSGLTNVNTSFKINSYDLTLFYEFKPIFLDMEVGLGADYWEGSTKIEGYSTLMLNGYIVKINKKTYIDESFKVILPYIYGHIETMKFFGVSVLGSVKWAQLGDNHHYDYTGAIKYTIDILAPVNPFIKVGYRYKDIQGKDGDNITQIKYKGIFAEIGAKF